VQNSLDESEARLEQSPTLIKFLGHDMACPHKLLNANPTQTYTPALKDVDFPQMLFDPTPTHTYVPALTTSTTTTFCSPLSVSGAEKADAAPKEAYLCFPEQLRHDCGRPSSPQSDATVDAATHSSGMMRKRWSDLEDAALRSAVGCCGTNNWNVVSLHLPGRTGKQCRERWRNHLQSGLNKDAWTSAEKQRLCELHQIYGNRWATIASFMPGRTNSAIKNLLSASLKRESSSPSPPRSIAKKRF